MQVRGGAAGPTRVGRHNDVSIGGDTWVQAAVGVVVQKLDDRTSAGTESASSHHTFERGDAATFLRNFKRASRVPAAIDDVGYLSPRECTNMTHRAKS
jgi:hypothetical protein